MRALLLFPVVILAACASATPKDLEKMSTLDLCYEGMMDPDQKQAVENELNRRKESCEKYNAQLKKMADQEMRAGGSVGPQDPKSAGAPSSSGGGMGRY